MEWYPSGMAFTLSVIEHPPEQESRPINAKSCKKRAETHSQFISRALCVIRVIAMVRQQSPRAAYPRLRLYSLRLLLIDKTAAVEHNSAHVSGASSFPP